MPETQRFHHEESLPEAEEHILTPEDYARLGILFLEAEGYGLSDFDRTQEAVALRIRIRDENGKAVRYIFENLNSGEIPVRSHDFYRYITWLNWCASEQHAQDISALLTRDEVIFDEDRSTKNRLVKMLERIGTPKSVEHLAYYASRCFDISYGADVVPARQIGLQESDALRACS